MNEVQAGKRQGWALDLKSPAQAKVQKQSAQAKVLERKWLRYLLVHGTEYGFAEKKGILV